MKHTYALLLACLFLTTAAFGQIDKNDAPKFKTSPYIGEFEEMKSKLNKYEVTGWYNYVNAVGANGETFAWLSDAYIWPDSLPVQTYDGAEAQHLFLHGVGEVFDPSSFYYTDPENFNRFTRYTIDSITFTYKYHNFGDSTDSIRIQFYDQTGFIRLSYDQFITETRGVRFDRTTMKGQGAKDEVVIAIDSTNNTPGYFTPGTSRSFQGVVQIPVNIDIEATAGFPEQSNIGAFTVQFVPGNTNYASGDTLNKNDSMNLSDPDQISGFSVFLMRGNGEASSADPSYNHGLMLYDAGIYSSDRNWFTPANPPGSPETHTFSNFHISGWNLSADEMDANGYGLGTAYPNPASREGMVKIPFALGQSEEVSLNIMDLNGQLIKVVTNELYTPGEHIMKVDLSDMAAGVYVYEMKAGNYSSSNKLIVR